MKMTKLSDNLYSLPEFLEGRDVVLTNVLRDGACGHLYECIEYYYLFKSENLNPAIYLAYDNFTKEDLLRALESKYDFKEDEIADILENTFIETIDMFCSKKIHNFSKVKSVVFVEALDLVHMRDLNMLVMSNKLIALRCALEEKRFQGIWKSYPNLKVFQDLRVYGSRLDNKFTKDHSKKILFNKLKKYDAHETNTAFIYLATDCRDQPVGYVNDVLSKYPSFNKIYVAVLDASKFEKLQSDRVHFIETPIDNVHKLFDTMIYLPVKRMFDCSPRFVPECAYYGKEVIYHNITYRDLGLEIRKKDIEQDVMSLQLTKDDPLFLEVGGNL